MNRHGGIESTRNAGGSGDGDPQLKAALDKHVEECACCRAANKRVNDFCPHGTVLFTEWVRSGAQVTGVEVLSEEDSAKVIEAARRKQQQALNN